MLSDISVGHLRDQGFGDLDVVAKHLVVADLEGLDTRLFALCLGDLLQKALSVIHDLAQIVHVLVVAILNDAALAYREGSVRLDRRHDGVVNIAKRIQIVAKSAKLLTLGGGKERTDLGQHRRRVAHSAQILSVCASVNDTGHQSLQIQHTRKQLSQLLAEHIVAAKLLHGVLAVGNGGNAEQRMLHPFAQHSGARRSLGLVQHPKQGSLLLLGAHRLGQLQIATGVDIHFEELSVGIDVQFLDIRNVTLFGINQIGKQRPHGADHSAILQLIGTKALSKLCFDTRHSVVKLKAGGLGIGQHHIQSAFHKLTDLAHVGAAEIAKDLTGLVGAKLVAQARIHIVSVKGCGVNLCRRDIGKAYAVLKFTHIQGAKIVVFLLGKKIGLDQRSGSDHAHHLTAHQALSLRRVLGLLANSDLVALLDQLSDIPLRGMEGHAAHGGALCLAAISARQSQLQHARRQNGIIKEHLVKVTETVKQEVVLVLLLDLKILLHHRGHGGRLLSSEE